MHEKFSMVHGEWLEHVVPRGENETHKHFLRKKKLHNNFPMYGIQYVTLGTAS